MTKTTTMVAGVACAAMLAAVACKKEDGEPKGAAKTTEPTTPTTAEPVKQPEPAKPMTAEEKAAFYQACWGHLNAGHMDEFAKCYADDITVDSVDSGMPAAEGKEAAMARISGFRTAFPDLKGESALILVNGNKLVAANLITGTHSGELKMGEQAIPPTNKKVGYVTGHAIELGDDNLAHREWLFTDQSTLMGQLGLHKEKVRPVMAKLPGETEVVIARDDDAERANLEAHKQFAEAWNKHDKAASAFFAPDAVLHDMTQAKDMKGKEITAQTERIWKGFGDAKGETIDMWAAGPYTVALVKNTGTNTGDVKEWKVKKTGKSISFTGLEIHKWEGGKVKEAWMFANGMTIPMQLGLIPAPGGAPAGDAPADAKK
jgi:predicted ester cyclase